ncbi:DUF503 domain-containing protein [Peptoniphilus asaccharolyticus]
MKLRIFSPNSLKEKRRIIKSLIQKMQSRFKNVSIAEVGDNDLWQSAIIGMAIVSNDIKYADEVMDKCIDFIDAFGEVEIVEIDVEYI